MALRRQLLLGLVMVSLLLCVYILCVNLSPSIEPLRYLQVLTQGGNSSSLEDPLIIQSDGHQWTPQPPAVTFKPQLSDEQKHNQTLETQKHLENSVGDESRSRSRSDDEPVKTRTSTRAPTGKPQQPTAPPTAAPKAPPTEQPKAKPTESPFIGDSYMSEDIPPQTDCPDGIRQRVTKTEFAGRFLQTLPVLQYAQHVTPEQHQRLSRYQGTHGWAVIDYNTLVETLSVLNSPANRRLLDDWKERSRNNSECIRCAVVGNGGILKDSKKGEEIDGHHYVFRTNGAIIEGFQQDVGSRTTHYTFSTNTLMNSLRSYKGVGYNSPPLSKETRYIFLPDHDRDYLLMKAAATHTTVDRGQERGKDPTVYFGADVSAEKLKMYNPDFIRYIRNRFLRSNVMNGHHRDLYRPSTGAVMLLAALHTCDQVSAYGFMTPDYGLYSDHYYDRSFHKVGFYINHDLRLEMVLWQQLHNAGLIRLYMHN